MRDELFLSNAFFDPRDLLQVKYEMLRRVREEGESVSAVATRFGLSRPTFYTALRAYEAGSQPWCRRAPGPRRAHKLGAEVVEALRAAREQRPAPGSRELVQLVRERFGLSVHRRSIERVLAQQKTSVNGARPCGGPSPPARFGTSYERLRGRAVRAGAVRDREGLAVLAQRGIAASLDVLATLPVPTAAAAPRSTEPLPTEVETRAVDIALRSR